MSGIRKNSLQIERHPNHLMAVRKEKLGSSCQLFYSDSPLKIVRAERQYMFDETGRKYLDCINNVCHVGHCHPTVVQALCEQIPILNTNNRFLHDNIISLAERLTATMPKGLEVFYFVNSGSEANDLALRLAKLYTKRKDVIVLDNAYHGHTQALIGVSPYKYNGQQCNEEKLDTTHVVSAPDSYRGRYRRPQYEEEELAQLYAAEVSEILDDLRKSGKGPCAFLAESLQCCGGQIIPPKGYLKQVYERVRNAGGVCIADEVQVGFGRVGNSMWAFQYHNDDVVPDIVTIGKPMGNGHPVAAVVTTRTISNAMEMEYFNTYGGNPVSCAAALAVLDVIEDENLLQHAVDVGNYILSHLNRLKDRFQIIGDIRGAGMFVGIDLVTCRETREPIPKEITKYIVYRLKEEGILLNKDGPHENVLKFKPPMCFTKENVDFLIDTLTTVFEDLETIIKKTGCALEQLVFREIEENTLGSMRRRASLNDINILSNLPIPMSE